jgi:3-oxoacid CoA-transferase B subunit
MNTHHPMGSHEMAARAARELADGMAVNLGIGIPTLVAEYLPAGADVLIHTENGALGVGPRPAAGGEHPDYVNAGKQAITLLPGASLFHHADSFMMIRGGHIDVTLLGGYEVAENGDLANWTTGDGSFGGVGGAMDLASAPNRVIVVMTHQSRDGRPKLLERCTLPLTGLACVDLVVTDIAVVTVDRAARRFVLREVAEGFDAAEVQRRSGAKLHFEAQPAVWRRAVEESQVTANP